MRVHHRRDVRKIASINKGFNKGFIDYSAF